MTHRATDSFLSQTLRDMLPAALVAVVAILLYLLTMAISDVRELERKAAIQTTMTCPDRLGYLIFAHSGFTRYDLVTPKYARLSCYYTRPIQG